MTNATLTPPQVSLPAEPKPETIVALVDTREQKPLCLDPLSTEPASLQTGDYSLAGLRDLVAVERKSLEDLVAWVGRERARFERELHRLRGFRHRLLIIGSDWGTIELAPLILPRFCGHPVRSYDSSWKDVRNGETS